MMISGISDIIDVIFKRHFCATVLAVFVFTGCNTIPPLDTGRTPLPIAVAGMIALSPVYFPAVILPYTGAPIVSEELRDSFSMERFFGENPTPERVMLLDCGRDAFAHRVNLISRAQKEILKTSFYMREGTSSAIIVGALLAAADRGVRISLIFDGIMSLMPRSYRYVMAGHNNIRHYQFNTFNFFRPGYLPVVFHDKYIIIDREIMIFGGRNIADRYFKPELSARPGVLDKEVLVYNTDTNFSGSIAAVSELFQHTLNSYLTVLYRHRHRSRNDWETLKNYYIGLYKMFRSSNNCLNDFDFYSNTVAVNNITLIYNPREGRKKEPVVAFNLLMMGYNSERVVAQSPYFTMTNRFLDIFARMSRGRDVTVLTNSLASAANPPAHSRYHVTRRNIINRLDITLYEYQQIGTSIHGKSFLFDDRLTVIGSFNLNQRSIQIDPEAVLVIDSKEFNAITMASVNALISKSLRVLDHRTYKPNESVQAGRAPWHKRVLYTIMGYILAFARHVI